METFSALLAICAGNSPVLGDFPAQRPVTRSFDVFFDLRSNKRLSKQWRGWWFETHSCPLWRHRNDVTTVCLQVLQIAEQYNGCLMVGMNGYNVTEKCFILINGSMQKCVTCLLKSDEVLVIRSVNDNYSDKYKLEQNDWEFLKNSLNFMCLN